MTGIVMTYFSRQQQLINTLASFRQYNPQEFFVVIVDDGSPEDIRLPEQMPFRVFIIKMKNKSWTQGDPAYNAGFVYALKQNPDIIIIQNAECLHFGNILGTAKKYLTNENYISFGCYSQGQGEVPGSVINNKGATFDGESAWYNHPVYRPKPYHFCSAIKAENLKKLNGFDERLSFGAGFDDDYFLHQIRMLGLEILMTTDPIVIHQWHSHNPYKGNDERELLNKNFLIYQQLIQEKSFRAKHVITEDLSNPEDNLTDIDFIQGHKFHEIATWTFTPKDMAPHDYYGYPNTLNIDHLKDGDIIYTQGFIHYKKQLLDIIRNRANVIIVSHNCDNGVYDYFDIPDNVIRWFAQNVETHHPKVESLPAGIENDINNADIFKKRKILAKSKEPKNIRNLVYMDHRIWTNPEHRKRPYEVLANKSWVTYKTDEDNVPFDEYIDNVHNHKFAICPRGNGISTYRPWEAMYVGTIPIVIRNINNRFYTELPICFVDDWEEVTEDFLNKEYDRIINNWNGEMLTFSYWKNKIFNYAHNNSDGR